MRRAALLAALAAPVLAAAQTAGKIVFAPDATVGQTECLTASGATIDATWNIQLDTSATTIGVTNGAYRVIGSNTSPPATIDGSTKANYCYEPSVSGTVIGGKTLKSGFVEVPVSGSLADVIPATATVQTQTDIPIPGLMAAAGVDTTSCSGTGDVTVYVCVHWYARTGVNEYSATPTGYSNGTLTLSFKKPPPPKNVSVRPGDGRLEVSFAAGDVTSGFVSSSEFTATAKTVCTDPPPAPPAPQTCDPNFVKTSRRVGASPAVIEGLVNFQLYSVTVTAYSSAGNASDPSGPQPGTPEPTKDFWKVYQEAGGTEPGGCATGSAGALALLGVASLVALRRRAK